MSHALGRVSMAQSSASHLPPAVPYDALLRVFSTELRVLGLPIGLAVRCPPPRPCTELRVLGFHVQRLPDHRPCPRGQASSGSLPQEEPVNVAHGYRLINKNPGDNINLALVLCAASPLNGCSTVL